MESGGAPIYLDGCLLGVPMRGTATCVSRSYTTFRGVGMVGAC